MVKVRQEQHAMVAKTNAIIRRMRGKRERVYSGKWGIRHETTLEGDLLLSALPPPNADRGHTQDDEGKGKKESILDEGFPMEIGKGRWNKEAVDPG